MAHMRIARANTPAFRNSNFRLSQRTDGRLTTPGWAFALLLTLAQLMLGAHSALAAQPVNPNPPTSLSAVANSSSQITVVWNDTNPLSANESGYEVQRVVPPSTSWVTVYTAGPNVTSWVNTGLAASTTYQYRVRTYAINNRKTDYSAFSPVASATTQAVVSASVPAAGAVTPTNFAYGSFVSSPFNLTATFSSSIAVTGCQYTIDGVNWLQGTVAGAAPTYTCSKTGITAVNGQVLSINMRATNSSGTGTGAAVTRIVDALTPATGVLSATPGNGQVSLSWSGSDSGSGLSPSIPYKLVYATGTSPACSTGYVLVNGTATSYTHAGLANGTTYFYRVCATDAVNNVSAGSTASATPQATAPANLAPVANAGPDKTVAVGTSVVFSGSGSDSDGSVVSYVWNFGDGTANASGTSVSHVFTAVGTYTVRLTVTDNLGATGSDTAIVTVTSVSNQPPVANVSPSTVSTQSLLPVSFSGTGSTDADGSIASYSWNFGDGTTGSGATVSKTYNRAGSYTAVLTVTDNLGSSGTKSVPVTVINRAPTANAGADQTVSAGSSMTLNGSGSTDQDGTITSYVWNFGDGTANGSGASVSHVYVNAGTYTATLTVTDNSGATSTDTAVITVTNAAVAGGGAFSWVKRYGGAASSAIGYSTVVDGAGNIIVVGAYWGAVNLGGSGLSSLGSSDIFVAKYAPDGTHLWSKSFGGTLDDVARSVAVDTSGNIYVSGSFKRSLNFGGASLTAYYSGFGMETSDLFIVKLNSAGGHVWSKSYGSFADDSANGIAIDRDGNVVVVGTFGGIVTLGGANLQSSTGTTDIFVAKYSATGTHLWSKKYGSIGDDVANGVAVDTSGNIFLVGTAGGSADFGGGPLPALGASDVVVVKLDTNANHLWSKQVGSNATDAGFGIAVDGSGNVFVTGYVQGSGQYGGGTLPASGSWDTFLVKYSATGGHLWSKQFGGSSVDEGLGVATDSSGNVILTGAFQGSSSYEGTALTSAGSWDIVVAKFSGAGSPVWTKRFGGLASDLGYAAATNSAGEVFVVGGVGGVVDFGGGQTSALGSTDMFLLKLRP
jgi:PKD repeat protein